MPASTKTAPVTPDSTSTTGTTTSTSPLSPPHDLSSMNGIVPSDVQRIPGAREMISVEAQVNAPDDVEDQSCGNPEVSLASLLADGRGDGDTVDAMHQASTPADLIYVNTASAAAAEENFLAFYHHHHDPYFPTTSEASRRVCPSDSSSGRLEGIPPCSGTTDVIAAPSSPNQNSASSFHHHCHMEGEHPNGAYSAIDKKALTATYTPSPQPPTLYTAYNSSASPGEPALCSQKAVAFLAGPRERICVLGSPIEYCPRCRLEGLGTSAWRPHRHIGELKIRYICERQFEDLESNHHFDIPLCPLCNSVLYLYEFNALLGVSNARRLHKYVLKCNSRHVLPLLDLFCQTKKGGERCNANFKLQWCYGTMVKRCEAQKNRDHDLWWVRYKNEWKQRRTIIRYKKDFLSHLSDTQRGLLLGLGLEGEPPPDPKGTLGPTFDALLSTAGGSPQGPKIKKRQAEKVYSAEESAVAIANVSSTAIAAQSTDGYNDCYGNHIKRRQTNDGSLQGLYYHQPPSTSYNTFAAKEQKLEQSLVAEPSAPSSNAAPGLFYADFPLNNNTVLTGTPMTEPFRPDVGADGRSPVAVSVVGELCGTRPRATDKPNSAPRFQPTFLKTELP